MKIKHLLTMALMAIGGSAWAEDVWKDVTSTYLTNADFEGTATEFKKVANNRFIYQPNGWTVTYSSSSVNDGTSLYKNYLSTAITSNLNEIYPTSKDNLGDQTYLVRVRDNGNLLLSQVTKASLQEGSYRLSADANCFAQGSSYTMLYVDTKSQEVSKQSSAANAVSNWKTYNIDFDITTAKTVTISLKVINSNNTNASGFDNFKLEMNVTKTLHNKIAEAKAIYLACDTRSESIALGNAITTAEGDVDNQDASTLEGYLSSLQTAIDNYKDLRSDMLADIADGEYYLKNNVVSLYLSNGAYWGSRSVLADQGIAYNIVVADGKCTLKSGINGADKALRPSDAFNDQSGTWEVFSVDGGVCLYNGSKYLSYDSENPNIPALSDYSANSVWTLETPAARKAFVTSESRDVDATVFISAPDFLNKDVKNSSWQGNPTVGGNTGEGNTLINNTNAQKWNTGTFDVYQEIADIPNGVYTLTVYGFYREGNADNNSLAAYNDGKENSAILYANNEFVSLKSVYSEAKAESGNGWVKQVGSVYIPNTQSDAAACFENGGYINTLQNIIVEDGKLKIGVKGSGSARNDWTVFDNFRLTYVTSDIDAYKASTTEYDALNTAIEAAEAKTLGFDDGEYAPYNNITAIKALAVAKALDQDITNTKARVEAATSALSNATWTANDGDVDIVYNGDMLVMDGNTPKGWYDGNIWGNQENAIDGKKVYYYNSNRTVQYGVVEGYTMPLKAHTVYQLTYSYGSQGNNSCKGLPVSVKLGDTEIRSYDAGAFGTLYSSALKTVTFSFVTTEAGNYTLNFGYNGNVGITDISLVKGIYRTSAEGQYGTLCLPYDFNATGAQVYIIDGIENGEINLTEASSTVAGQPYIYCATADKQTFVPVNNEDLAATPTDNAYLVGSFNSSVEGLIAVPENAYVLQTQEGRQGFFKVTSDNIKCGLYKCYLKGNAPGINSRSAFFFDGDETAIEALEALTSGKSEIYDLNGRRLERLQKGINIVNGTKIVVK